MSEAVILSLITALTSIITAVLVVVNNNLARQNAAHIKESKEAIVTLEKNTNSIKDALVKVTGEAEFAKGLQAGIAGGMA